MIKVVLAFFAAAVCAAALGAVISSHFVMNGIAAAGADVTLADRALAAGLDIVGLGPTLGAAMAPFLAVGFGGAALAGRFAPGLRGIAMVGLGAIAVIAALLALKAAFGVQPVSGARTDEGLGAISLAGAIAGFLFARLTAPAKKGAP